MPAGSAAVERIDRLTLGLAGSAVGDERRGHRRRVPPPLPRAALAERRRGRRRRHREPGGGVPGRRRRPPRTRCWSRVEGYSAGLAPRDGPLQPASRASSAPSPGRGSRPRGIRRRLVAARQRQGRRQPHPPLRPRDRARLRLRRRRARSPRAGARDGAGDPVRRRRRPDLRRGGAAARPPGRLLDPRGPAQRPGLSSATSSILGATILGLRMLRRGEERRDPTRPEHGIPRRRGPATYDLTDRPRQR